MLCLSGPRARSDRQPRPTDALRAAPGRPKSLPPPTPSPRQARRCSERARKPRRWPRRSNCTMPRASCRSVALRSRRSRRPRHGLATDTVFAEFAALFGAREAQSRRIHPSAPRLGAGGSRLAQHQRAGEAAAAPPSVQRRGGQGAKATTQATEQKGKASAVQCAQGDLRAVRPGRVHVRGSCLIEGRRRCRPALGTWTRPTAVAASRWGRDHSTL